MSTSDVNHSQALDTISHFLIQRETYQSLRAIRKQVKLEFGKDLHLSTPEEAVNLIGFGKLSQNPSIATVALDIEKTLVAISDARYDAGDTPKRTYRGVMPQEHDEPEEELEHDSVDVFRRTYRGVQVE